MMTMEMSWMAVQQSQQCFWSDSDKIDNKEPVVSWRDLVIVVLTTDSFVVYF